MRTNTRGQTWEDWLSTTLGLLTQPRLLQPKGNSISMEFKYLMEHRPDVIVLLMHRHQSEWMPVAPRFVIEFNRMKVLCQGDTLVPLSDSILTTVKLRQLANSFGFSTLPFIFLRSDIQDTELHEWTFLKQFNVITDECLDFYIKCIMEIESDFKGHSEEDVFKIYAKVESLCRREDMDKLE